MQQPIKTYTTKHIRNVSIPILIGLLAQNIINVTDTAFLGRVGEIELGASAMGGLFYICLYTIFFGFSTGAQIIISRRNGEKNHTATGPVMIQGILFLLIPATLLYILTYLNAEKIMHHMITSATIRKATVTYLQWRVAGFFFDAFNVMFRAFYVGITRTKNLTHNAILMSLSNIGFDYILIFGKLGFPAMGLEGAAIASVISEAISTLYFITHTRLTINRKKYGLTNLKTIDPKLLGQVLKISIYTMFQYFISMSTYFLFFIAVERQGPHTLAIANIVRSIYMLMFIPLNALSATSNTLVSNIIGEGKITRVLPLIRHISLLSFLTTLSGVTLLCLFPHTILSIYTNDPHLITGSIPSLYVSSIALLISSIAGVTFNSLTGTGNTRPALLLETIVLILYTLYIYLTGIHLKLPIHICFGAEILYFTGILIGSILYLRFAPWQKKKI
jgi:putative MATE family efflux protein